MFPFLFLVEYFSSVVYASIVLVILFLECFPPAVFLEQYPSELPRGPTAA